MIKAIFMDYSGTVTHENGPIAAEVVKRVFQTGDAESPEEVFRFWWKGYRERLEGANGEHFRTQHDVALEQFRVLLEHFHSSEEAEPLLERMEEHWRTVPVYDDARQFLEQVKWPVYFVTNSDDSYVNVSMKTHGIRVQGVITSEQARYSKPREEIFQYALKKTGLRPEEVFHIGDSLESDVRCPGRAGIEGIWLNRSGMPVPGGVACMAASTFEEVERILERKQEGER